MLNLNPAQPYLWLLKVGLWAAAAGVLFVSGCNHGQDRQAAEDQDEIAAVWKLYEGETAVSAENLRAANACGALLADVNRQTQRQIDEAARAKTAAEQAADRAEQAAKASQSRATAAEKALQAAKAAPMCRSQLEMALCADIPLL